MHPNEDPPYYKAIMDYIIYTFKSSNMAFLALDKVENENIIARLVPLLPEIDAGCGLCLRFEKKYDKRVEDLFSSSSLSFEKKFGLFYEGRKAKVYDIS